MKIVTVRARQRILTFNIPMIIFLSFLTKIELVKLLYDNKVYLTPYWEMQAPIGWFRVIFSVYSDEDFRIGK